MDFGPYVAYGALTLAVYKIARLFFFLYRARKTGLPYVLTPFLETEVIAILLTPILRTAYHAHLDKETGWPRWCRFVIKDWSWEDKRGAHEEYGDVFLVVSPEGIICYSADAAMGWDVMNRRKDFTKPRDKYKILEPYGPNVATAEGGTYRFHVRVTASSFNDQSGVNDLVMSETIYQTQRLCEAWVKGSAPELQSGVNSLTLAVISLAGFGQRLNAIGNSEHGIKTPLSFKMSFLQAISDTTKHMVSILLLPGWLLLLTPLRKAHSAHQALDQYLRQFIRDKRQQLVQDINHQDGTSNRGNLLTAVLRASLTDRKSAKTDGARKDAFTEEETMGNLFIYLLAGYETTANAIVYGLFLLALHPEIQEKVICEVDQVWDEAKASGRESLSYQNDFDKFIYTYGFMYESFRLFPGVTLITKVANGDQPVHVSNSSGATTTHILSSGIRVYLSAPAVHYHPRYWPEPNKIDPQRWTQRVFNETTTGKHVVAADRSRQMKGTLLTFSDGARACLGRKFAQAEYIAFFAAFLKGYRVKIPPSHDRQTVWRDIHLKSAGQITLAPLDTTRLMVERR